MVHKIHKKGDLGFLVAIIIVILSFMLIAGTIFGFMSGAEEKEAETLCKDSVALRAAASFSAGGVEAKIAPLLCQTIDKKVSGSKEEVQQIIADKMARCWEIFGEGRYKTSVFENTNAFSGDSKCFVCSTILVEDDRNFKGEDTGVTALEFENFLRTADYPKKSMKYLDYFQYGGGPGYVIGVLTPEGIKPGRAYGIAFKAKSTSGELNPIIGTVGGTSIGVGAVSMLVFGVGTGGLGLLIAGGAALGVGLADLFQEDVTLDGIFLVDLQKDIQKEFYKSCNLVADIAGT
ncbi:hypothetical protein COV17_01420 [Candidatus Woesearchaeota archaeon CG10_big_fil_rev_8_21_14_0_10_36_11]|nr:MAG: hypothetical protein COV17_01420 [Candidatus Woesearchaeota archaeon CG10_big_fil_rev_8_21_14_0_10_36_11]